MHMSMHLLYTETCNMHGVLHTLHVSFNSEHTPDFLVHVRQTLYTQLHKHLVLCEQTAHFAPTLPP